jgi:hypothetical protein
MSQEGHATKIKELSESSREFITSLNENVNEYDNSDDKRKIESFNSCIIQKIIDASIIGKRSVLVNACDLYEYKTSKEYYKTSTEDMGLVWHLKQAQGEPTKVSYGTSIRTNDLIEISFSRLDC